jgi:hypothetical protein
MEILYLLLILATLLVPNKTEQENDDTHDGLM